MIKQTGLPFKLEETKNLITSHAALAFFIEKGKHIKAFRADRAAYKVEIINYCNDN